jgi:hypothetical protein
MPKLLLFAPCEKVVFSSEDNTVSLISVLQGFQAEIAPPTPGGGPPALPISWSVLSLWVREEGDGANQFEERWDLVSSEGRELISGNQAFVMTARFHRNNSRIAGFPIPVSGDYTLRLLLRNATANDDFHEIATFPVPVTILTPAPAPGPAVGHP